MSRKKHEIPVPRPGDEAEYICPSASWGDMTGLIPYAATDRSSCEELYPCFPEYGDKSEEKQ